MTTVRTPGNAKAKKGSASEPQTLELSYTLAELPTSQHRAGLAGLVVMIDWLRQQGPLDADVTCEVVSRSARSVVLRINQMGLERLFDVAYAATVEESPRSSPFKKKGEIVPPLRTEEVVEADKKGEPKKKTLYIYPITVPDGAFVRRWDPSYDGNDGLWYKLWRDMLWQIVRGVPAQRKPFDDRAAKKRSAEARKTFASLAKPSATLEQPSTYLLGAQATTPDNVPFRDRARFQLLLHFWPFVVQIYKPFTYDRDQTRVDQGYALAIPDVADLDLFCQDLPEVMRARPTEKSGYLPRAAVIDLAAESALVTMEQLDRHVRARERKKGVQDLVLGFDVVHTQKQGNNVRILSQSRVDVRGDLKRYVSLRQGYWSPFFRHQRIANYLSGAPWFQGMDRVVALQSWKQAINDSAFRHDAREAFETMEDIEENGREKLILQVVKNYLSKKMRAKHGLTWEDVKDDEKKKDDWRDKRGDLARDAFLAIRSRTGSDFVEYFTGTLCSVPHHIKEEQYLMLSRELLERSEDVRTLTLLALSASAG